jgi:hypothetical protein
MYFGTRHTATAMGFARIERTCSKCGKRGAIEVAAIGLGIAHAPYLLDPDAGGRAEDYASDALSDDAARSAGLLPCGSCGARQTSAVRWAVRRGMKPLIVVFPLTLVSAAFVTALVVDAAFGHHRLGDALMAMLVLGFGCLAAVAISAIVVRAGYRKVLERAESAASWMPETPLADGS